MTDSSIIKSGDQSNDNEISLKGIILKLRRWRRYLLAKWKVLLVAALIGGGLGLCVAIIKKPTYTATLTFILEDANGGTLGAYSGLASQLGLTFGGDGDGSDLFSDDNIMGFMTSRFMVQKTLLKEVEWNGQKKTLADVYISIYHYADKWKNDTSIAHISFPIGSEEHGLSRTQDSIITFFYTIITKRNLDVSKSDKKVSFIAVNTTSVDERFSKLFTEKIVEDAIEFYVKTKTQREQANVNRLQLQADSILVELNKKTYGAALVADINLNPARKITSVGPELVSRDKGILTVIYTEVVKNLEIGKMALLKETPIIQIIDSPILPLEEKKLGKLKGISIGVLLGIIMCSLILVTKKIYVGMFEK